MRFLPDLKADSLKPFRYLIIFFLRLTGAIALFFLIVILVKTFPALDSYFKTSGLIFWLTKFTSYATLFVLNILGYTAQVSYSYDYTSIIGQGVFVVNIPGSSGIWIGGHCLGLKLILLFILLIVSYPSPSRKKIWYVTTGVILIELIYIARLVWLVIVSKRVAGSGMQYDFGSYVTRVHDNMNTGIYILIVIMFIFYARYFSTNKAK